LNRYAFFRLANPIKPKRPVPKSQTAGGAGITAVKKGPLSKVNTLAKPTTGSCGNGLKNAHALFAVLQLPENVVGEDMG